MSNLAILENKSMSIWDSSDDLKQIKEIYGKGLSAGEFNTLVQMGRATGLNPFLKEIWAVKYGDNPAQIFIGRDGYRKSAQRHSLYDYHVADAVYSNDLFEMNNGQVTHKYNLKDRGTLVGAYCTVQRKGSSRPTYVYCDLKEYSTGKSLWNPQTGKQATMIKKVAECQGLKSSFQELFAGTYSDVEEFNTAEVTSNTKPGKGVEGLKAKLGMAPKEEEIQDVDFNHETGEVIEAEVEVMEPESDGMSADTIIFLIESAGNSKELIEAMKHLKDLSDDDKKKVYALYKKKEAEFKK